MNSPVDLCKIPAAPPPNGYSSNFNNPTSLGPALVCITTFATIWAIVFTLVRLYINLRKLGWADCFNLIALLHSVAILGIEIAHFRFARHIWDVPACFFDVAYTQETYVLAVLLQTGAFFAKTSIFLLYLWLFKVQRPMRIAVYAGIVFSFCLYGAGTAVATYYEIPRAGEKWTDTLDGRTEITLPWWQAQSGLSVVLDLYIFILPLPVIAKLRLPVQKRIQLVAVFSLAVCGIAASIASLIERINIAHAYDQTWISAILSLCSAIELNVAIILSSAPAFAGFARNYLLDLPVAKLILSGNCFRRSKLRDSEAPLEGLEGRYENYHAERQGISRDGVVLGRDHRYYELDDVSTLNNGSNSY
ncbi:hypothetical protein F4680DRAFT_325225 [Xylaria scruposa]|nr:hypothetical protein F4680DRAFT_325225 [Xylaria scruposa]